jgi:peptidoglycan L-alanyl-D-glutamate endopeptidase CwlK
LNEISEQRLAEVHPHLARIIRILASDMEVNYNEPIQVEQAFRNWATQEKLWESGRTAPGPVVTHARPGHSWHEFGLAVDVCPLSLLSKPNWDYNSPLWLRLGALGKSLGLFWGGDFVHCSPDRPHFQLTGVLPVSPDDATRLLFQQGGIQDVWDATGLSLS